MYVSANKFAQRPGFRVISFIDYTANGLEEALINRGRHPFTNGAIYYQRLVKATVTVERASDGFSRSCEIIKTNAKHATRIPDGSLKHSLLNISRMLLSCFFVHERAWNSLAQRRFMASKPRASKLFSDAFFRKNFPKKIKQKQQFFILKIHIFVL